MGSQGHTRGSGDPSAGSVADEDGVAAELSAAGARPLSFPTASVIVLGSDPMCFRQQALQGSLESAECHLGFSGGCLSF
jgi:hypothetical protein